MEITKPELTGSERQIEWANTIRESFITFYHATRPSMVARDVQAHPEASYWINNRYGLGITNADQREIQKLWRRK